VPREVRGQVIDVLWDNEAQVWVATSDDVPGLATESPTLFELVRKLQRLVPELNALNSALMRH
jgi:hypothetical protein